LIVNMKSKEKRMVEDVRPAFLTTDRKKEYERD
jgi:hypothetical protein